MKKAGKLKPNRSGVVPLEYKVVILPAPAEVDPAIKRAKDVGLQIPPEIMERELLAQIRAEVVAIGGNAFEDWRDKSLPRPGAQVMVAKYAGVTFRGADGEEYRLINDKDIAGLVVADGVARI